MTTLYERLRIAGEEERRNILQVMAERNPVLHDVMSGKTTMRRVVTEHLRGNCTPTNMQYLRELLLLPNAPRRPKYLYAVTAVLIVAPTAIVVAVLAFLGLFSGKITLAAPYYWYSLLVLGCPSTLLWVVNFVEFKRERIRYREKLKLHRNQTATALAHAAWIDEVVNSL